MTKVLGIDTSKWQGLFDFSKAKAKGVKWVIFKGSDVGSATKAGFVDEQAFNSYRNAKANGLLVGAYHWMDASRDGEYQARYYLDNVYNKMELDMPPVLDVEEPDGIKNKAEYIKQTKIWLDIVEAETGRVPMVYTANWYLSQFNKKLISFFEKYPLWVAYYANVPEPVLPYPWKKYTIWQYASNASYPNYTGTGGNSRDWGSQDSSGLDMNYFNGSMNELLEFCKKNGETPIIPDPEPDEVLFKAQVNKIAPDRLRVRRTPNGIARPESDWLKSEQVVDVYEVQDGWWRHGVGKWSSASYMHEFTETPVDPEPPIDPEPPVVVGGIYYGALYWQRDPRWISKALGTSGTIGNYGCAMVSETNCLNQLGVNTNPMINNDWRTKNGGYLNGNLINWAKVSEQHPNIVWEGRTYNPTDSQMLAKINNGYALVILVDHNEGTPTLDEHWVNSVNRGDGQLWIFDPWDNQLVRLRDRYKKPLQQFTAYKRVA